jgi:hypothetical protein
MKLEHTYYDAIYEMVTGNESSEIKTVQLKKLKAKITRLHTKENKRFFLDNNHIDVVEGEDPSIIHIIRALRRQHMRLITTFETGMGMCTLIQRA